MQSMLSFIMRSLGSVVAVLLITSVISATLPAQTARSIPGLRVGATVKVKTDGELSQGKISELRGDSMWVALGLGRVGVSLPRVDSAWTRERSTGVGLAIGAASGAVLFGAFGWLMAGGLCDAATCPTSESVGAAMVLGFVGATAGLLIGGGAGALIQRWKRRLPL